MRNCYNELNLRVGQVKLARDSFRGIFVAVEGESDKKLYSKLFNDGITKVLALGDKEKVLSFLRSLSRDNKVCGIVDNDYWPVTAQKPYEIKALFVTDTHDLETLIIRSQAFRDLIAECCDEDCLTSFLENRGSNDLREILVAEASKVGALRLVNDLKKRPLRFNCLDFEDMLDRETLTINIDKLYKQVSEHSSANVSCETLKAWVEQCHQVSEADPWILSNGHDMVQIFLFGLKEKFSKKSSQHADIDGKLRISFNEMHFERTNLCQNLCRWAESVGENSLLRTI